MDEEPENSPIFIVRFDKFNQKSSGLTSKTYTRGKVIALGSKCDPVNGAQIGDVVRFTHNGGLPVNNDGRDYLLLSEKDIMFVED